jgi:hypothetical protein
MLVFSVSYVFLEQFLARKRSHRYTAITMNDLSRIRLPGPKSSAALLAAAGRATSQLSARDREKGAKDVSGPGVGAPIEKAHFGKGNPRKTGPSSWIVPGLAWPGSAKFGLGSDRVGLSRRPIHREARSESDHANSQRDKSVGFLPESTSSPLLQTKIQSNIV